MTDMSVFELAANVPKLKRVGLVKVINITDEAIHALVERASTLERLHLSYCENLTVPAITYLLNKLPRLTHLSLTGVSSFRTSELQAFCRPAPREFNEHQARAFCVFSGNGISDLRRFLNFTSNTSDEGSTRRDSASSSESAAGPSRNPTSAARGRLPSLLDPSISTAMGSAFASNGPNFLAPAASHATGTSRRRQTRDLDRQQASASRTEPPTRSMPDNAPANLATSALFRDWLPDPLASGSQGQRQGRAVAQNLSRPVEPRYTPQQRSGDTANHDSARLIQRDAELRALLTDPALGDEADWDRARWMGAPAAYMGRMLRMAGLRRQRERSGSPASDVADPGEGSGR